MHDQVSVHCGSQQTHEIWQWLEHLQSNIDIPHQNHCSSKPNVIIRDSGSPPNLQEKHMMPPSQPTLHHHSYAQSQSKPLMRRVKRTSVFESQKYTHATTE
jgi:hypothetical protein